MKYARLIGAIVLGCCFTIISTAQINNLPPPPVPDVALLNDIFKAAQSLQEQARALEFKEKVSFRLAAIIREGRANRPVDFRQSADYAVTIRPGQPPERRFLSEQHGPRFSLKNLASQIDVSAIQETLPPVVTLQTGLFAFVNKEYVNGYKEAGREKIKKINTLKLELRFRPGRFPVEECTLWIDEITHAPVRAKLKIGAIGRYENVSVLITHLDINNQGLPGSVLQEMECSTFERGIPIRLEHTSLYSELRPAPVPR